MDPIVGKVFRLWMVGRRHNPMVVLHCFNNAMFPREAT